MARILPLKFNLRNSDKVQELKNDLEEFFLIIRDAHCAYEIWWMLVNKYRRRQYASIFFNFKDFFEPVASANLTAMIIALFKLYDQRGDTLNFIKILENAKKLGIVDCVKNKKFTRKLSEVTMIWEKICILRHKVLAHRDYFLTRKQVYTSANITPNKIRRMIDLSIKIFNAVWLKVEKEPKQLEELTYMDTIKILEILSTGKKI